MNDTLFLVGFFKFNDRGPGYGFKRMDLVGIFRTEEEARDISFCDEAGWYEGVLIEERWWGHQHGPGGKRVWFIQKNNNEMEEIQEPLGYTNVINLI